MLEAVPQRALIDQDRFKGKAAGIRQTFRGPLPRPTASCLASGQFASTYAREDTVPKRLTTVGHVRRDSGSGPK